MKCKKGPNLAIASSIMVSTRHPCRQESIKGEKLIIILYCMCISLRHIRCCFINMQTSFSCEKQFDASIYLCFIPYVVLSFANFRGRQCAGLLLQNSTPPAYLLCLHRMRGKLEESSMPLQRSGSCFRPAHYVVFSKRLTKDNFHYF